MNLTKNKKIKNKKLNLTSNLYPIVFNSTIWFTSIFQYLLYKTDACIFVSLMNVFCLSYIFSMLQCCYDFHYLIIMCKNKSFFFFFFWFLKYYCYEYCFSPFEMGNDIKFSYLKFVLYLRLKIEMQE